MVGVIGQVTFSLNNFFFIKSSSVHALGDSNSLVVLIYLQAISILLFSLKRLVKRMTTLAIDDLIRHKVHKNIKKLFLYFYQTIGVQ